MVYLLLLITGSVVVPMLMHVSIDMMALVIRPAIRGAWRQPASD